MEETTDIVVATPVGVSLGAALHDRLVFAGKLHQSSPDDSDARWLSWATGNQESFAANGKTPLPAARGWYIDCPGDDKFPDDFALEEAMAMLCEQHIASECMVMRQNKDKTWHKVPSWHLPMASLFVVCEGIPSKTEMVNDPKERWGVAFSGYQNGVKSSLSFYCYIKELMDAGYPGLFRCQFSAFLTDPALKVLRSHQDYTLRFAEMLRAENGITSDLAYYSYALPIRCSTGTVTARNKETGESKELYYPIPSVPLLSLRTPQHLEVSLGYLESVAITDQQAWLLEANGRVERIVEWSINRSQRLTAGEDLSDDAMISLDESPF